jgi:hypothetical protein
MIRGIGPASTIAEWRARLDLEEVALGDTRTFCIDEKTKELREMGFVSS